MRQAYRYHDGKMIAVWPPRRNAAMAAHDRDEDRRAFWVLVGKFVVFAVALCAFFVLPFLGSLG